MSPAVTRATAATAPRSPLSSSERSSSPSTPYENEVAGDDRRNSSTREPFVPKRKPTKTTPYAYLSAEASGSVDSLPILDANKKPTAALGVDQGYLRPASALDSNPHTSSPFAIQQDLQRRQPPSQARTTRSASRNLTLQLQSSAPPSVAPTPVIQSRPNFEPEAPYRPRSHTPTTMTTAARTSPPVVSAMPKIKAAVSADVAARIRSPKKHASTSSLRPTALQRAVATPRVAQPSQLAFRDVEVYAAHSSSNWIQSNETWNEAEGGGDCSFVYDADNADEAGLQETVQVHVRLRPPKHGEDCAWVANPFLGTVALEASIASARTQSANLGSFTFDGIQTGSANRPVYIAVARPLVRAALDGYDAVVFAYGQTASGKTFTLSGDEKGEEAGIIPRAVRDIFRGIKQSSATREYLLRASYLEIWNEVVKDLLEPSNVPQVRDDKRKRGGKGTTVHPLREEIVTSAAQVRELLARGQANRHVGATDWNERSSRSHTCFKITIESWERNGGVETSKMGKKVTVSELCLIDLAGSEKYVSQGFDRRAEGAHINKSLLTLGKVIYALSEKAANSTAHIPYRDSKLTRILQNSLSGNARVAVVCTINPNPSAVDETLSTLNFAKRIKKVNLNARRNEVDSSLGGGIGAEAQALILRYQTEADALRKMVADLQSNKPVQPEVVEVDDERIRELQERLDLIGSLVVRGGRDYDLDSPDSADEEETRAVRAASAASSTSFGNSTPTTSRSTSQSSSITTSAFARPVSPTKSRPPPHLFGFSDPPHLLAEKLFLANRRIASLTAELAARPALPSSRSEQQHLILSLQQQVKELEAVCEAQATDAPPKIREDVEREYEDKLHEMRKKLEEKDSFIAELQAEGERVRRVNARLMELAHDQTKEMVESLASPARRSVSPLKASDAANTVRRRMVGGDAAGGSPFKARARPMSLFNPPLGGVNFAELGRMEEDKAEARKGSNLAKRRSISNDYTLLKGGTQEIEEEILLKSATIPPSETFANVPLSA